MKIILAATVAFSALLANGAFASVTPQEAAQLGATLTGVGAEKAGNADGSIPAYTGGTTEQPPGFDPNTAHHNDPYASEKPVRIDGQNYQKYSSVILPSIVKLLQTDPSYYLNLYPTHRTAPFPKWVLDNTLKNATSAHLVGDIIGDGVAGAYGGIPFPIPKNGYEVMWNFVMRWQPGTFNQRQTLMFENTSGGHNLLSVDDTYYRDLYYDPSATSVPDNYFYKQLSVGQAPSSQVGYNILINYSIDYSKDDQLTWVYTPGQRRVRVAPEFEYDTPSANLGGSLYYDEIVLYSGRMDRFNFKLVGKKEMLIPYNMTAYNSDTMSIDNLMSPRHPNPAPIRWEKHRLWVVEATLKPGARHILQRKTFYFDEDSWLLVAYEGYDHAGTLYRAGLSYPFLIWDADVAFLSPKDYSLIDMTNGSYFFSVGSPTAFLHVAKEPVNMSKFSPQQLQATGVR